jgi:hypothetical protein
MAAIWDEPASPFFRITASSSRPREVLPAQNRCLSLSRVFRTLGRSFHGESVHQGVVVSPNVKFSYDFLPKIAGGLEYYGSPGPVTGFDSVSQQQHQIFPD